MWPETSLPRGLQAGRPRRGTLVRFAVPVAALATLLAFAGWHGVGWHGAGWDAAEGRSAGWDTSTGPSPPTGLAPDRPTYQPVQSRRPYGLAPGKFLIARRKLIDPNFAQTVVLLFKHDEEGSIGLIINRATDIKLSDAVDHFQQWEGDDNRLYKGGPVTPRQVTMLIRTDEEIEGAHPVFDDVHLGAANGLLQSLANGWDKPKAFRAYTGYAGWGVGQLEGEMKLESWYVLPARGDIVFDPYPETVWGRLIDKAGNVRWVRATPGPWLRLFRRWPAV